MPSLACGIKSFILAMSYNSVWPKMLDQQNTTDQNADRKCLQYHNNLPFDSEKKKSSYMISINAGRFIYVLC